MSATDLRYKIALSMVGGIGAVNARNLIAYVGSVEGIFKERKTALMKIPGIGEVNASKIINQQVLSRADEEVEFIARNNVKTYFYLDKDYPTRLSNCPDAPIIFYLKGDCELNTEKIISIVGTRNATEYGKNFCNEFIEELSRKHPGTLIISGLAYGIDVCAHKAAIKHGLPTIGVVAHGLETLYPSLHQQTANEMMKNGALLSDFPSNTDLDRKNFLRRNRIVAGLADATIVAESANKGGALITADIAFSYNRDVFALPGRKGDRYSEGCNTLIKHNKAGMLESVDDLEYFMNWKSGAKKDIPVQTKLFVELNEEEKVVVKLLQSEGEMAIDRISLKSGFPMSRVSSLLLNLEFNGMVRAFPGKVFRLR